MKFLPANNGLFRSSMMALCAGLMACPAGYAATATTQPVGAVVVTIPTGSASTRLMGAPLAGVPVFRGAISANNASTVTVADGAVNFATVLTAGKAYYLETVAGPASTYVGDRLEIDTAATIAAASNVLTLNTTFPIGPRKTISPTTDILASYQIAIREHKTLASVFGNLANPLGMYGTTSAGTADNVLILNGQNFETYYYLKSGTTVAQWRLVGGGPTNYDNAVIAPGTGMIVKRNTAAAPATTLTMLGEVRSNIFQQPLVQGYNLVGEPFPRDHSPNLKAMTSANGFYGTTSAGTADNFLLYNGTGFDAYYLLKSGTNEYWRKLVGGTNVSATELFLTDGAALILKRTADSNYAVPVTFTL